MLAHLFKQRPALRQLQNCLGFFSATASSFEDRPHATDTLTSTGILSTKVPLAPGKRLAVHALSPTQIRVNTGDHESILLEVKSHGVHRKFTIDESEEGLAIVENRESGEHSFITAWIPERFCSLDLSTRGGGIKIQGVTEAGASAYSYGGNMDVGNIKGTSAVFDTGGGSITGTITAGEVRVNTAGGLLLMKRLAGEDVEAMSEGGDMDVGVCYCDDLSLDSGGAPIKIDHLHCSGTSVVVQSHGGDLSLSGVDGTASLLSQGGNIDMQVTERPTTVSCSSSGGNITAKLAPGLCAMFHIQALGGIDVAPDLGIKSTAGESKLSAKKVPDRAADGALPRITHSEAEVHMDAGTGRVQLTKLSWMDSISAKLAAKKG